MTNAEQYANQIIDQIQIASLTIGDLKNLIINAYKAGELSGTNDLFKDSHINEPPSTIPTPLQPYPFWPNKQGWNPLPIVYC